MPLSRFGWTWLALGLAVSLAPAQPPGAEGRRNERWLAYPQQQPAVGVDAPTFVLSDLEGKEVRLNDLIGKKPIVIEFGSYT